MKHIILCADDYGQNADISQAIIALIQQSRLSATSCLTTFSHWKMHAKWLEPFKNQIDIGLHFNLTEGKLCRIPASSLGKLLLFSQLRFISQQKIEEELHAQLDQFESEMKMPPRFIDGHQHVHQFPVIRDALLSVYEKRLWQHPVYFRCTDSAITDFKNLIIQFSGARAFKKKLIAKKIPHNASFLGIYNFASPQFEKTFQKFLSEISEGGLIMCHPGLKNNEMNSDKIAQSRGGEFHYLSSQQFVEDCKKFEAELTRFKDYS